MTFADYLIDLALIGIVVLQIRGRRLTAAALLLPMVLVAWVADSYLKTVPTAGNDLLLVAVLGGAGLLLGTASGLTTRVVRNRNGQLIAKAGVAAAVLWTLGMGFRLAFQLYASHGGAAALGRFSVHHHITDGQAWVAALVIMAIAEAVARTAVLAGRAWNQHPDQHAVRAGSRLGVAASGMMAVGEHVA